MSWRTRLLLAASAGALLAALPALGQDTSAPKSLLPPGFGDNQNLPPPAPKAEPQTRPQPQQQQAQPTPDQQQQAQGGGTNMYGGQQQQYNLPAPNQIAAQSWNNMAPSQQQMLLGQYEANGWDKNDVQALYNQALPKYAQNQGGAGTWRLQ